MCVRQKSVCLDKEDVVQVKDAFKWAAQGLVGKELGASVLTNVSVTVVNVSFITLANSSDQFFHLIGQGVCMYFANHRFILRIIRRFFSIVAAFSLRQPAVMLSDIS